MENAMLCVARLFNMVPADEFSINLGHEREFDNAGIWVICQKKENTSFKLNNLCLYP